MRNSDLRQQVGVMLRDPVEAVNLDNMMKKQMSTATTDIIKHCIPKGQVDFHGYIFIRDLLHFNNN